MTPSPGTPAGSRRRPVATGLALGILLALGADAVAVAGLPNLRASWTKSVASPGSRATATPAPRTPLPSITLPAPPSSPKPSDRASESPSTGAGTSNEVKVTDAIKRGVVLIESSDSQFVSRGTGMLLTSDGQILTNYHVVRSSTSITVTIASTGQEFQATLVGRSADKDVALLDIKATGLSTVTPDKDVLKVGHSVVAAGNAAGQGYVTAFSGQVLALNQNIRVKGSSANDPEENLTGLIETNAHAVPGDSGGPLYDAQNEVTGMTTAGAGPTGSLEGTVFAVPISDALAVVAQVRRNDETGGIVIGPKAALGITVNEAQTSVTVATVVSGGAAAKAGIKKGDRITALNGRAVASVAALSKALDQLQPGATVKLEWLTSAGGTKQANVVLGASTVN